MWLLVDDDAAFAEQFRLMLLRISVFAQITDTAHLQDGMESLSPRAVFVLRPSCLSDGAAFAQCFCDRFGQSVPLFYIYTDEGMTAPRGAFAICFENSARFLKETAVFFAKRHGVDMTKSAHGLWADDLLVQTAFYNRMPLPLSKTQYRILRYLLKRHPAHVPMRELAYFTLPHAAVASSRSNIATQIAALNRATLPFAGKKAVVFEKDGYILQI